MHEGLAAALPNATGIVPDAEIATLAELPALLT
jgi:hypothetical protein